MCNTIIIYILTVITEVTSGHVIYSEEFVNKTECETKAKLLSSHKYVKNARCDAKTIIGEKENVGN